MALSGSTYSCARWNDKILERAQAEGLEVAEEKCRDCGARVIVHPPALEGARLFALLIGHAEVQVVCDPCLLARAQSK